MGMSLTPEEQFEIFGTDKIEAHAEEAERRWGHTDAWRQSQRRAAAYTKEDWIEIKAEADENLAAFAAALGRGEPATGPVAGDLAETHRQHISRWFYDCGPEQHRRLAELYVADFRYGATYEAIAPGLSRYIHDAIVADAARARKGI